MTDLTDAIADVEKKYFRGPGDTGANSNALFIHNRYRTAAGLPELTRTDLYHRERNDYITKIGEAFCAGDVEDAMKYKGYIASLDKNYSLI